jgi:hypothetical protein
MAQEALESAQKALRVLDYDSSSDEEDEDDNVNVNVNDILEVERGSLPIHKDSSNISSFFPSSTSSSSSSASGLGFISGTTTSATIMTPLTTTTATASSERGMILSTDEREELAASRSVAVSFDPYSTQHPLLPNRTSDIVNANETQLAPTIETTMATTSNMFQSGIIVPEIPIQQLQSQSQSQFQSRLASKIPAPNSLFDDDDSTAAVELPTLSTASTSTDLPLLSTINKNNTSTSPATEVMLNPLTITRATSSMIPGAAGYLEMEEEPPRLEYNNNKNTNLLSSSSFSTSPSEFIPRHTQHHHHHPPQQPSQQYPHQQQPQQIAHPPDTTEPIRTDSGLLLTHRKMKHRPPHHHQQQQQYHPTTSSQPSLYSQPYPPQLQQHNLQQQQNYFPQNNNSNMATRAFRNVQQEYFEVENGFKIGWRRLLDSGGSTMGKRQYNGSGSGGSTNNNDGKHSMATVQTRRLMSFVKLWVVLFALVLLAMTGAFWHSLGHTESTVTKRDVVDGKTTTTSSSSSSFNGGAGPPTIGGYYVNGGGLDTNTLNKAPPQEILLLPLDDVSKLASARQQQQYDLGPLQLGYSLHGASTTAATTTTSASAAASHHHQHRFLRDLRDDFEMWMKEHKKVYHSDTEKEHRFSIWTQNHHRTMEKNRRHGLCSLTQQHVFGSNRWKDLAPEEFTSTFLTGYKGALTDELEEKMQLLPPDVRQLRMESGRVLDPTTPTFTMYESVKRRHLQYIPKTDPIQAFSSSSSSSPNCKWYDLSCYLRWVWRSTGIQLGSFVRVMEPKYDSSSYPNRVDWRDAGAVTAVRTQGDCGACWAITAVETVESAHYLSTGSLYNLAESEIIACDDSCKICDGGWPQNAYEWVMDHGGLPLLENFEYDATTLKTLTEADGTKDGTVDTYRSTVCPANDRNSKDHGGSGDNSYWKDGKENNNYQDNSGQGRYGNIKGYGYATNRCVCYSDGSGCDCKVIVVVVVYFDSFLLFCDVTGSQPNHSGAFGHHKSFLIVITTIPFY